MLVDDLVDVADRQPPVPDAVRIDDDDRALVVLLIAAHTCGPDPMKIAPFHLVAEPLQDPLRPQAAAMVAPHRGAHEDMQVAMLARLSHVWPMVAQPAQPASAVPS